VAGGRHTPTETVVILKQLASSIGFPTSRSNTNSRIAWATNFLWVDGLDRHSAPQGGVGVFEAALGFKPRRAVRRGTRAACLRHGNIARVARYHHQVCKNEKAVYPQG